MSKNKLIIVAGLSIVLLMIILSINFNETASNILGVGSKSITLSIKLPTETIDYNINTNSNTLDEVLMEHDLANLTHLGMGSVINSIAGYKLREGLDWYDVYVNGQIVYIQTSNINIENSNNYTIAII